MQLYNADLSPFASRVRLAIYAKALPITVASPPGGMGSEEYKRLNPSGKVPALVLDDGSVLPESEVILEYLDDRFPAPALRPSTAEDRARARLISRIADLYLMAGLGVLFGQLRAKDKDQAKIDGALTDIARALGYIEPVIDAGPYAVGGKLSGADCGLAPMLFFVAGFLPRFGRAAPFAATPKLAAYWAAVAKDTHAARVLGEMQAALAALNRPKS
jgi:glutathione S-transferase